MQKRHILVLGICRFCVFCLLNDFCFYPAVEQCFCVVFCRSVVDVVFLAEQMFQRLSVEFLVLNAFPEESLTLVHADNLCEVDVLFAFCNDNTLAANVLQDETFLYLHFFTLLLFYSYGWSKLCNC